MRKRKILLALLAFLYIVNVTSAYAVTSGSTASPLSAKEAKSFLEGIGFQILADPNIETGIRNFTVGEDGAIALIVSECCVHVYEPSGTFRYGIHLDPYGDFVVDFQEGLLAISFVRNNYTILIDATGKQIEVEQADNQQLHLSYVLEKLNQTTKEVNGVIFRLEREIGIGTTYSKLVAVDEQGELRVLYDLTVDHQMRQIFFSTVLICFCAFVVWGCINKRKK